MLARRQHGVVARRQLLGLGLGRRVIAERLQRGQLHRVHFGIYVVGSRRISRRGRWMAAVLAAGEGAALSHRSAARLWGVLPMAAEWVDVTCPADRNVRRKGIVSHSAHLVEDEWQLVDGIPVTSPFRTLLDLSAVLDERRLDRALNEIRVRGLTDRMSLQELLHRHRGRRGTAILRQLLEVERPEGIARNDFEEAFLALVDAHGLPRPRLNADLALRGRFFEIDCLWTRQRVALELDGRGVHGTPRRFESDRQRDRILVAEGWRAARVTWLQLRDEPEAIVADLRLVLASDRRRPSTLAPWTGSSSSTT